MGRVNSREGGGIVDDDDMRLQHGGRRVAARLCGRAGRAGAHLAMAAGPPVCISIMAWRAVRIGSYQFKLRQEQAIPLPSVLTGHVSSLLSY